MGNSTVSGPGWRVLCGDCREVLSQLEAGISLTAGRQTTWPWRRLGAGFFVGLDNTQEGSGCRKARS